MEEFVACFAEVVDPRQENACHDLHELLLIALCTILTGGKDCSDMALFGELKERWPGEFRQAVKWIFCLSAARMPRIRSKNDEASTPEPQPGFQGKGGVGRHQGREDAG